MLHRYGILDSMIRGFLTLLILLAPVIAASQSMSGVDPLTVNLSPRYPRPYETVTLTPQSTLVDLSGSTVVVVAAGKEVGRGSGRESYQIPIGGTGTSVPVKVTVTAPDGVYTEELIIRPADVSLVIDAISTAHPFYQGGALVAPEGRVRVIALADLRTSPGSRIASSDLIYTWKSGGRILTADSGLGKSVLTATAPVLFRDANVSVTIASRDGAIVGEASVHIAPTEPLLLIYKDGPLEGPRFLRAVSGTYELKETEEAFRAVPYFFAHRPTLNWKLGSDTVGHEDSITVRTTGSEAGVAALSVNARQTGEYYSADAKASIQYGSSPDSGFFGI